MNKIAAYQEALLRNELEKRASALVERYGTCDGYLPASYAEAFMEMEKEALLAEAGKTVTKGIYGLGKFLGGVGESGARTGVRGGMMDWASSVGGKVEGGAAKARLTAQNKALSEAGQAELSPEDFAKGRETAQRVLGGAALGTAGLGLAGGGYLLGRPSN
jgi:hypothetical protein